MDHIKDFTRCHWMPLLGEYLRCIAPTANMVIKIIAQNTKSLTKGIVLLTKPNVGGIEKNASFII